MFGTIANSPSATFATLGGARPCHAHRHARRRGGAWGEIDFGADARVTRTSLYGSVFGDHAIVRAGGASEAGSGRNTTSKPAARFSRRAHRAGVDTDSWVRPCCRSQTEIFQRTAGSLSPAVPLQMLDQSRRLDEQFATRKGG